MTTSNRRSPQRKHHPKYDFYNALGPDDGVVPIWARACAMALFIGLIAAVVSIPQ